MRKTAAAKTTSTTSTTSAAPAKRAATAAATPVAKPAAKAAGAAPKPPAAKKPVAATPAPAAARARPAVKAAPAKATKKVAPARKAAAKRLAPAVQEGEGDPVREKARKARLVRDSFTMPEHEYEMLGQVKKACLKAGFEIKKSELLRIGVALIGQLDLATLQNVLASLPQLKTGRPKKT